MAFSVPVSAAWAASAAATPCTAALGSVPASSLVALHLAAQALRADRLMLDEDVEAALAKARAMPWPDPQPR